MHWHWTSPSIWECVPWPKNCNTHPMHWHDLQLQTNPLLPNPLKHHHRHPHKEREDRTARMPKTSAFPLKQRWQKKLSLKFFSGNMGSCMFVWPPCGNLMAQKSQIISKQDLHNLYILSNSWSANLWAALPPPLNSAQMFWKDVEGGGLINVTSLSCLPPPPPFMWPDSSISCLLVFTGDSWGWKLANIPRGGVSYLFTPSPKNHAEGSTYIKFTPYPYPP